MMLVIIRMDIGKVNQPYVSKDYINPANALLAQLEERKLGMFEVFGSIPKLGSKYMKPLNVGFWRKTIT